MKHATGSRTGWDYKNLHIKAGMFTKIKMFLQAVFYIGTLTKVQILKMPEFKLDWVIWSHL